MSDKKLTGGYAFPFQVEDGHGGFVWHGGMVLRDYFAAAALQGMLGDSTRNGEFSEYVQNAYKLADAMLEERKK